MSESQQKPKQYNSWTVYSDGSFFGQEFAGPVAFNSRMGFDGTLVPLRKGSGIVEYTGSYAYGNRFDVSKDKDQAVIVCGICLFDGRWKIKFPTGGERRLVLGMDKGDALGKLDVMQRGKQADSVKLSIPVGLRKDYHEAIIKWQAEVLSSLPDGMTVLYSVPVTEYITYLDELKPYLPLSTIQEQIDGMNAMGKTIKDMVTVAFGGKKIQFVDPMTEKPEIVAKTKALAGQEGIGIISSDVASFLAPYVYPELWVKGVNKIIGVEDITELRLAYTANALNSQVAKLVEVCVPAIPDPYSSKEPSDPKKEVSFEVERLYDTN